MTEAGVRASFAISFRAVAAHGDGEGRPRLPNLSNQFPTGAVREADIRNENVAVCGRYFFKGFCFAAGTQDEMPCILEIDLQSLQTVTMILDYEYS